MYYNMSNTVILQSVRLSAANKHEMLSYSTNAASTIESEGGKASILIVYSRRDFL